MHASRYQIVVSSRLGVAGREAFRAFRIEPHGMDTALTGDLTRRPDLALELIGLTCLAREPDTRLAQ